MARSAQPGQSEAPAALATTTQEAGSGITVRRSHLGGDRGKAAVEFAGKVRDREPTHIKAIAGMGLAAVGFTLGRPVEAFTMLLGAGIRTLRDRRNPNTEPGKTYDRLIMTGAAALTVLGFITASPLAGVTFWASNKVVGDTRGKRSN